MMNKRKIKVSRLNYIKPEEVLIRFQDELNLIYLDSANHIISEDNRYSYLALDPIFSIKINRNEKYFNLQKFQKVKKIISEQRKKMRMLLVIIIKSLLLLLKVQLWKEILHKV